MKQEVLKCLSTIKEDILNLSKFLYENPEGSFHEYKACDYIVKMLKEHGFRVKEHYLDIPTAFYAEFGSGYPRLCYICEYDAAGSKGHITGHNLISSFSVGAAISLAKALNKTKGTVIVLGCPGEFVSGAKITMAKQGTFEDIDVVMMAHPDVITAESGTSTAVLPLRIEYKSTPGFAYRRSGGYTALDACLLTFNAVNFISRGLDRDTTLDGVITEGGSTPNLLPDETESRFYIRAPKMCKITKLEKDIRELVRVTGNIMNIESKASLYELPYEELITNSNLSRLFFHNLKESGVIEIDGSKDTASGLSLGTVSHLVPCIHPYVSIVEDKSIHYATQQFALATVSYFAQDRVLKTAQALAMTGLDLIENNELLKEISREFYESANSGQK